MTKQYLVLNITTPFKYTYTSYEAHLVMRHSKVPSNLLRFTTIRLPLLLLTQISVYIYLRTVGFPSSSCTSFDILSPVNITLRSHFLDVQYIFLRCKVSPRLYVTYSFCEYTLVTYLLFLEIYSKKYCDFLVEVKKVQYFLNNLHMHLVHASAIC